MPIWRAPSMSAFTLSPTMTAAAAGSPTAASAASKMAGCGFRNPSSADEIARREDVVEGEVGGELVEGALRVRDQPDLQAGLRQPPQDRLHVVVEEEVMAGRPLVVDVPGREVRAGATPAHVLDDRPRVVDEQLGVVVVRLHFVEHRRRLRDGRPEQRRVDRHAVAGAEEPVALALKGRAGVDQREVDVEEDRARHRFVCRAPDRNGDHYTGRAWPARGVQFGTEAPRASPYNGGIPFASPDCRLASRRVHMARRVSTLVVFGVLMAIDGLSRGRGAGHRRPEVGRPRQRRSRRSQRRAGSSSTSAAPSSGSRAARWRRSPSRTTSFPPRRPRGSRAAAPSSS